jgi:hypothetical protein
MARRHSEIGPTEVVAIDQAIHPTPAQAEHVAIALGTDTSSQAPGLDATGRRHRGVPSLNPGDRIARLGNRRSGAEPRSHKACDITIASHDLDHDIIILLERHQGWVQEVGLFFRGVATRRLQHQQSNGHD